MLPSSNQGLGINMGFPDVCLTPAAPAPIPVPYPNLGMNSVAMPFAATILLSFLPAHSMAAKPLLTMGDNAGVAHPTFMGTGQNLMGNPRILLQGMPAETLCNPTNGNNFNDPCGAKLVPSITNCLMGAAPGDGAAALARELLDAPCAGSGLTLARERGGWRVVHARRGGRAARAGVRAGDLVVAATPDGLVVRAGRRARALAWAPARAVGPVAARVQGGVGRLVLRRCSLGAPAALARALAALDLAGARALVLDLRGNPGGELRVAGALAALLAQDPRPLVVLVDGGTASAAELLAAALVDGGRAVLAGAPTFGKDVARAHTLEGGALVEAGPAVVMRRASGARLGRLLPEVSREAGLRLAARAARARVA
jgi:carboxyl-terminal processing protease